MVTVKLVGGLGNNLYQWAYARICAETLGMAMAPHPIDGFAGTRTPVNGNTEAGEFYEASENEPPESIPAGRPVHVGGWKQQWGTMLRHRERLREWLAFPANGKLPHEDDVVVHVRLGDYLTHENGPQGRFCKSIPTYGSFYGPLLDKMNPRQVHVVTDSPTHPYIAQFKGASVVSGSPIHDFRFIASFRRAIISQSTFSWWAVFLSTLTSEVYYPRTRLGIWTRGVTETSLCEIPGWTGSMSDSIVEAGESWWLKASA